MPRRRPSRRHQHQPLAAELFSGFRRVLTGSRSLDASAASRTGRPDPVGVAAEFGVEVLERRTLLTTIGFGVDPFTGLSTQADGTFEYAQGNPKNIVRVAWHDLTAELIGVSVDPTATDPAFDVPVVGNLYDAATPGTVPAGTPNLFTIYITHSTPDSWLSIAEVPETNTTGDARPMNPYGGSVGALTVTNAGVGKQPTFNPGEGAAFLGNTFVQAKVDAGVPVMSATLSGPFGLYPGDPSGLLLPGVIMAPTDTVGDGVPGDVPSGLPNDIGYFMFGGTITGRVSIPRAPAGTVTTPGVSTGGNVGVFYAGNLLTGDAQGLLQGETADITTSPPTIGGGTGLGISAADQPTNFFVGGDLRDLVVGNALGGDLNGAAGVNLDEPRYLTGFHGVIAGTLGEITVVNGGDFGTWEVQHDPTVVGLPDNLFTEPELEYKIAAGDNVGNAFQGGQETATDQATGELLPLPPRLSGLITNDTLATAQVLGSIKEHDPRTGGPLLDSDGNYVYESTVNGLLQDEPPAIADTFDYYGLPLMAGQTVTVTATTTIGVGGSPLLQAQVYDPDGLLIATDENQQHPTATLDKPFSFKTDRPGLYKVAITRLPGVIEGEVPYTLKIENVGDMGLGGLTVLGNTGEIFDAEFDKSIQIDRGDLGIMFAGGLIMSNTLGPTVTEIVDPVTGAITTGPTETPTSYLVAIGNLRVMQAASIGFESTAAAADPNTGVIVAAGFGDIPYLDVPSGSVGLVSEIGGSPAPGGSILALQTRFDLTTLSPPGTTGSSPTPISPIGGSFQVISATDQCYLVIAADAGIGTIRAAEMSTNPASFIEVNADNTGSDGIIDLIDVTGSFGNLGPGGPGFVTNEGGDIRFMRIGGPIFTDRFFGNSTIAPINAPFDTEVDLTDDSGNILSIVPVGQVTAVSVLNADGTTTTTNTGPSISYETYPVRDKGGQVPISIAATTTNATVPTAGLTITATGAGGAAARAEIGSITFIGQGLGLAASTTTDTFGNTTLVQQTTSATVTANPDFFETDLTINGPATVDVLDVIDNGTGITTTPAAGSVSAGSIFNRTGGDLVDVTAASDVNTIFSAGDVGIATPRATPAAILPQASIFGAGAAYPLNGVQTGLLLSGNLLNLIANGSIGNVSCAPNVVTGNFLAGTIQNMTANANGTVASGRFDGIAGDVLATRILNASIGQGILPSGSGGVSFAGLFVTAKVGTITSNSVTYIRGNIISLGSDQLVTPAIDAISITGSIINCDIGTYTAFNFATEDSTGVVIPTIVRSATTPTFQIGSIKIFGAGGIIGSFIHAYDIGPTAISPQGFGVLNSVYETTADGHIGVIAAGGYGIRGVTITGGQDVDGLIAYGNGSSLSTQNFPQQLRFSEQGGLDPFFIGAPGIETDLDLALGVSQAAPSVPNVTDTGVVQDCFVQGRGTFGTLQAQKVRTSLPVFTPVVAPLTPTANIPKVGQTFPMSISFGNGVGTIQVRGTIDGLQITAGHLGAFIHGSSVSRLGISTAGAISTFIVHGNLGQTITDPATGNPIPDSYVQATGPTGVINGFFVAGSLSANVTASADILTMTVVGDVVGSITAGGQANPLAIRMLHIGGSLRAGGLNVTGSVGTIITNGGLGVAGGALTISGNLGTLAVGIDHHRIDSAVGLDLHVGGTLNVANIFGRIDGSITTDGDLNRLIVSSPILGNNLLNGSITVNGRLGSAALMNGNVNGNITVNGSIGNITLVRGSVLATRTIESQIDSIQSFHIMGGSAYGMFGSLLAPTAVIGFIDISGNIGDGTDAAFITAASGSTYHVRSSIATGTTISLSGQLGLLLVDGNINAGATVTAHPLTKLIVRGANSGNITGT